MAPLAAHFGGGGPPPSGGAITIAASTWRWDGVSGSVLVSSGVPLQPAQVTAANLDTYRVFVSGVEQAIGLRVLDGTFPDGSYRSIGTQYVYTLTHDTPVAAEIRINQGTRGTVDLTWVEPTKASVVSNRAVIAPTDPVHLCKTFVTLFPLVPAADDGAVAQAWSDEANLRWTGVTSSGALPGSAMYMPQTGQWAQYCRTGNRTYYQWAYDWSVELGGSTIINAAAVSQTLLYHILPLASGNDPLNPSYCTGSDTDYNPELLVGNNNCAISGNEAYANRHFAFAPAYWMTAWRQFKRSIDQQVQHGMRLCPINPTSAKDTWIDPAWQQRFNLGVECFGSMIPAYLMGCTTPFAQEALGPLASFDYETFLPLVLDALEEHIWAMGGGDYRDGLVGMRHTAIAFWGDERNGIINFQIALITEWLMLYYDNVAPDSRIPGWMTTIANYLISQIRPATVLDPHYSAPQGAVRWVMPYHNTPPAEVVTPTFNATIAAPGTAAGATTNAAGYGLGVTSVTLAAAGAGTLLVGDAITFAGHATVYRVLTGVANVALGGTITFERSDQELSAGLTSAIPAANTAITVVGTVLMTWTAGPVQPSSANLVGVPLSGADLHATETWVIKVPGHFSTTVFLRRPATGTGTNQPYFLRLNAWYLAMMASTFGWVYAYTGDPTYKTWAERAAYPGNVLSLIPHQTKTWAESWGGSRLSVTYYLDDQPIRGTPGVHPTNIVNPPSQPVMG